MLKFYIDGTKVRIFSNIQSSKLRLSESRLKIYFSLPSVSNFIAKR